ncbi:MAG: rod shape-determining protein MreD [Bacteroidetes bacterium]|nr:rod shape-determining protein MreD [Bacteroidota bacterium]
MLNKLNVSVYIHPYVYPMFLILLPFETPKWIMLPLAFAVGITIDMFNNTAGMHAAACVFIAYARPWLIKAYTPITGYENVSNPSISQLGVVWFALFTLTVIFIHHTIYYLLQIFVLNDLGFLFLKIVLSTLVSTLLIVIFAFLFAKRKANR